MAIKGISKSNLKIIAMTSVAIFSLMSVFTGAFAWFTSIKNKDMSDSGMPIKDQTGKLNYIEFHDVTSITTDANGRATGYSFEKNYYGKITYNWTRGIFEKTGNTSIQLDAYNPLDTNHPVLMVIALNEDYPLLSEGYITINGTTETEYFIGERDGEVPAYNLNDSDIVLDTKTVGNKTYNVYPLTSAVQFYYQDFSASEYTTLTSGTTLDYIIDDETGLTTNETFVTVDNEAETSELNQTAVLYASEENSERTVQYISLVIDYYPDAIEFIYSTFLGDTVLEDDLDSILYFTCDWSLEII